VERDSSLHPSQSDLRCAVPHPPGFGLRVTGLRCRNLRLFQRDSPPSADSRRPAPSLATTPLATAVDCCCRQVRRGELRDTTTAHPSNQLVSPFHPVGSSVEMG